MKSVELFCGAGGLALGLHDAGIKPVVLFERDRRCADVLSGNRNWNVQCQDVRGVDFGKYEGRVDIVSGGPPCQPFSLGGNARGMLDERDMFPEACRAIREIRPKAFVFENVKGLLRKSFAEYFEYILLRLRYPSIEQGELFWQEHLSRLEQHHTAIGSVPEYNVLFRMVNAADYGVPQVRCRVFIVGIRSDVDARFSFPEPTHSREALLHAQAGQVSLLKPWVTVREAIEGMDGSIPNNEPRDGAKAYAGHTGSALDWPSKALKAGVHGVPGGENMIQLDDGTVRYYTTREAARIQTFPDDYVFRGPWSEDMRQIGNAVPVKLAAAVGRSVAAALGGK